MQELKRTCIQKKRLLCLYSLYYMTIFFACVMSNGAGNMLVAALLACRLLALISNGLPLHPDLQLCILPVNHIFQ